MPVKKQPVAKPKICKHMTAKIRISSGTDEAPSIVRLEARKNTDVMETSEKVFQPVIMIRRQWQITSVVDHIIVDFIIFE